MLVRMQCWEMVAVRQEVLVLAQPFLVFRAEGLSTLIEEIMVARLEHEGRWCLRMQWWKHNRGLEPELLEPASEQLLQILLLEGQIARSLSP
jgi:hypothetical protein